MRNPVLPLFALLAGCAPLSEHDDWSHRPATETQALPIDTGIFAGARDLPAFDGVPPKNVLMISIDTWRRDHFDRFGDGREFTPFMASLAEQGLSLDDHTTCSNWTYAGTTCTILGMYNIDNDFLPKIGADYRDPVPSGTKFLASYLVPAGYHNLLVSGNSWLGQQYNNAQGYHDADPPGVQNTKELLEVGIERLEAAVDPLNDKWFLHMHLMEPHVAYKPPDEYLTELEDLQPLPYDVTINEQHYDATSDWPDMTDDERDLLKQHLLVRYRGELRYMDDQIAEVFADIDAKGYLDDTLVVFWTDHGEAFWEHEKQSHAWTLHRPENDGIAFFWSKNMLPTAWGGPTVAIDLAPTILGTLGLLIPDEMTGIRVGQAPPGRDRFGYAIARGTPSQSIRQNEWKLIFTWDGTVELYNLDEDPDEVTNVYTADHPVARSLWALLKPRVEATAALAPEETLSWPPGLD